jgi:hypothetical protein
MDFFAQVTKPSKGTQETVKPERVNWNKGLKGAFQHTSEARARIGAASAGRRHSEATCIKLSNILKGRSLSEEHRAKIVLNQTGRIQSASTRAKRSAKLKGRVMSEEWRAKISQALLNRKPAWYKSPMQTPNGVFTTGEALVARVASDTNCSLKQAYKKVRNWMKLYPNDYYYVA